MGPRKKPLEPKSAPRHEGVLIGSNPLGLTKALDHTERNENERNKTSQDHPETLNKARSRMLVALNTE